MNKAQVKQVINRVGNFVKNYGKSLDGSRLDGSSGEKWLMKRARATDEPARESGRRDAWAENKDGVRRCLNIATDIDRNMRNYRYGAAAESHRSRVRFELNTLADVYNLPNGGARPPLGLKFGHEKGRRIFAKKSALLLLRNKIWYFT